MHMPRVKSLLIFSQRLYRPESLSDRQMSAGYLFILPALSIYIMFVLIPTLLTGWLSFFKWDGFSPERVWVGLVNYRNMLHDRVALLAFTHNMIWVLGAVAIPLLAGLLIASFMASIKRGRLFFRVVFFLPMVFPPAVLAIIWQWIYSYRIGLLNTVLRAVGLESLAQSWLGQTETVLGALIVAFSWSFYGFCVIILLGALQNVDPALKEAARIDGANAVQVFLHVTLPSIRNELTFMITFTFITSMKSFVLPYIMTKGGPAYASEVIGTLLYRKSFVENSMGYGAALATVLTVIVVTVFLISRIMQAKRERA